MASRSCWRATLSILVCLLPSLHAFKCTFQDSTCAALGEASAYYVAQGPGYNPRWCAAAAGNATDYCSFEYVTCTFGLVTGWCVAPACCHAVRWRA
jgi:hypothetical protein